MASSFHDVRFPSDVGLKATGGPRRRTEIVQLVSGHEERNTRWANSRRQYNVGYGVSSLDDLNNVVDFFEQRRGRLYGFRWKDHADFRSCPPLQSTHQSDQNLGSGDGINSVFQLQKTYGAGAQSYVREITKPVGGTVLIAVNGEAQQENVDFLIDTSTGILTFLASAIPASGHLISAGFEFDVPVRFDTDFLEVNLQAFKAGQIPDISIIEIKQ